MNASGPAAARRGAGYGLRETHAVLEVTGPDARAFLQNQLPVDVATVRDGEGRYTARLDRKGRVLCDFLLLALETSILLLPRREFTHLLAEDLERYRIREAVNLRPREDLAVVECHGPSVPGILKQLGGERIDHEPYRHTRFGPPGFEIHYAADPWTGDLGGHLLVERARLEALKDRLRDAGAVGLGPEDLEVLRIEGGTPLQGRDMDAGTLLPELGRETMVDHDKGCYLGQETVARIQSRGHVNRILLGLEVEGTGVPEAGSTVLGDGAPVGRVTSAAFSPALGRGVALATMRRPWTVAGATVHVEIGDAVVAARLAALPLYHPPGPREQAEAYYQDGLEAFRRDRFEEAIEAFRKALLMHPSRHDVFEAIGVCQERLGRLDEAIATMADLAAVNPGDPMVWSNLSRYYAAQGKIAEAEEAKSRSLVLSMKQELGDAAAKKKTEALREQERRRLEQREGLFLQVLDLDPADVVANFGLGKIYLDLERFEEAAVRFRAALEAQEDYSMAYNHLGTCLAALGRPDEAMKVFREGIEAAARKGDWTPQREMARKLAALEGDEEA